MANGLKGMCYGLPGCPPGPLERDCYGAAMTLPTLMSLLTRSAEFLLSKGISNGRREAEWIFAESLELTRLDLYTRFDMPLEDDQVARLRGLVTRRGKREPLAYVLGTQEFHGLRLRVGPGVLVPRPETEELVDHVVKALPTTAVRVLDIGTGSGAIALAVKRARGDCTVEAVDVSAEALTIARANAATLELEVAFRQAHLSTGAVGPYAAVVANLPYIGSDERGDCDPELAFEPAQALFSGQDGLPLIAELIAAAPPLLGPGGLLWLEHGWKQGAAIMALCAPLRLDCAIIPDLAGRERFARISVSAAP